MASTLKKKVKQLQDVYDHVKYKLMVLVLSADNLEPKNRNGLADPYVRLAYGKHAQKTRHVNKTLNPLWEEFFYFEPTEKDVFTLEVWSKCSLLSDDFMGMAEIGHRDVQPTECMRDLWLELRPRPNRNDKDKVRGRLHVRMIYSVMPETRIPEEVFHKYLYRPFKKTIDTGDLIFYDGIGVVDSTIQLQSSSPFSRVGLVVRLPNKWTKEEELFVLEVTRNIDEFNDAFMEKPKSGVCLFRLFERIHQFHGNAVWLSKMKRNITTEERNMLTSIVWNLHMSEDPFTHSLTGKGISFLIQTFGKRKKEELIDFYGAYAVGTILYNCGVLDPSINVKSILPVDLTATPNHAQPVVLRVPLVDNAAKPVSPFPAGANRLYFSLSSYPRSWASEDSEHGAEERPSHPDLSSRAAPLEEAASRSHPSSAPPSYDQALELRRMQQGSSVRSADVLAVEEDGSPQKVSYGEINLSATVDDVLEQNGGGQSHSDQSDDDIEFDGIDGRQRISSQSSDMMETMMQFPELHNSHELNSSSAERVAQAAELGIRASVEDVSADRPILHDVEVDGRGDETATNISLD